MTRTLPALLLLAPALLLGQDLQPTAPADPPKPKNPLIALLQPNSVLSGVLYPWYDENRRLSGVFRAKTATLVTKEILDGKAITVELYNPDRSPSGRLDLPQALYDQPKGKLIGTGHTKLTLDNMTTTGTGLVFVLDQLEGVLTGEFEGFLTGPVTTRIKPRPKTAMHSPTSSLPAAALLSASMLAMSPAAESATAPPPAAVEPATASAAPRMAETNAETRAHLRSALEASAATTAAATKFLEAEELLAKTAAATPAAVPEAMALDVEPGPNDAVINCDGGMYFQSEKVEKGADVDKGADLEKGVLVYLGNVTATKKDDFLMKGANELKAFATKRVVPPAPDKTAAAPKAEGKEPAPGAKLDEQWELDRIVATGAVYFKKFQTKKKGDDKKVDDKKVEDPIEASGAIFTYHRNPDGKSDEFILSGGKPWVKQGGIINRAKRADQTIRIHRENPDDPNSYTSSFSPGGTETILPTKQLQEKNKEKDKDEPKAK